MSRRNNYGDYDGEDADGSGILSGLLGAVGLGFDDSRNPMAQPYLGKQAPASSRVGSGMKKPKKAGRPKGSKGKGGGPLSDMLGMVGLGMNEQQAQGGGPLSMLASMAGLGMDEEQAQGSGILSGILDAVGLGMKDPESKQKHKLFKEMITLERTMHHKGTLTPAKHNRLKLLHKAHGEGFFDNVFSGIKKAAKYAIENPDKLIDVGKKVAEYAPQALKVVKGLRG